MALIVQLIQFQLNLLFGLFHLLHREPLRVGAFGVGNTVYDLIQLFLQHRPLTLQTQRDLFKLRVADDNSVVIAGSDTGAELFTVAGFKVSFRCNKDIGSRIELQKLRRPLFGQVIRHDEQALLTQPQAL